MEKTVKEFLVAKKQGIEIMRQSKNHMEIRGIDNLSPAFVHPDFVRDGLTIGTVPVSAGVAVHLNKTAVRTPADMIPQLSGFAADDGIGSFSLNFGLEMSGGAIILIRVSPYGAKVRITQCYHLPSGQKDWLHG